MKIKLILLMITDGKKWHYFTLKYFSELLKGITSKHDGDFYCLNCLHSHSTKGKLKKHKKVCENHNYRYIEMPNKIIKYNHGEKCMKNPFIINADTECLLERIDIRHNNPKRISTTNITIHLASCHSLFTDFSVDKTNDR